MQPTRFTQTGPQFRTINIHCRGTISHILSIRPAISTVFQVLKNVNECAPACPTIVFVTNFLRAPKRRIIIPRLAPQVIPRDNSLLCHVIPFIESQRKLMNMKKKWPCQTPGLASLVDYQTNSRPVEYNRLASRKSSNPQKCGLNYD